MLKITDAVQELIESSDVLSESLRMGVLNYSALAQQLRPEVERRTHKTVKPETIVVALSRLAKQPPIEPPLRPEIIVDDLSLKSSLCDVSFEKTSETLSRLSSLHEAVQPARNDFFTVTQGVDEITVIVSQEYRDAVIRHMKSSPKAVFDDAVGIIVRFSQTYLDVPNTVHVLLAALATKRVNVIEIISTYTELSAVVERADAQTAFAVWSQFLRGPRS